MFLESGKLADTVTNCDGFDVLDGSMDFKVYSLLSSESITHIRWTAYHETNEREQKIFYNGL